MNTLIFAAATAEQPVKITNWNIYSWLLEKFGLANTYEAMYLFAAGVILCIILPYLIGSINPAIIFSKKVYHDDIRTHGSGNAGTTNTLRTYGKKMAALILLLDFLKAVIAVVLGSLILSREVGGAIAGIFVILGHTFPIYYKFKGGKGVASLAGVVLVLSPISFAILL
ncbi:MAG: glycerol-3-phosphate acyltransferase, partial [Eubacteriales bacterium]